MRQMTSKEFSLAKKKRKKCFEYMPKETSKELELAADGEDTAVEVDETITEIVESSDEAMAAKVVEEEIKEKLDENSDVRAKDGKEE